MHRFLLFVIFCATTAFGQNVRDNFNRPATPDIGGSLKWTRLFGQSDPAATLRINPDSTVSPVNPLGTPSTGGVFWDSTVSGRVRLGFVLAHKSGMNGVAGFAIQLMTDSSLHSGDGYGVRLRENSGTDAVEIIRVTSNGTSAPGSTTLATLGYELAPGDTILFDSFPGGRKTAVVRGAGGGVDSVSVVDATYAPASWRAWFQGTVFPDSVKVDDFVIGTVPYVITASAGAGGTISPSGMVSADSGVNRSFMVTPNTGYHIDSVVVDGVNLGAIASHTFSGVNANHTIAAYFTINVYSIVASAAAGGTITPSGSVSVNYGASQSFTIAPNTGYHIDSVVVDGVNAGAITSRTFTGVTANHTIAAYFSINSYTLTAAVTGGGSISPSGAVIVTYGANQLFTINPNAGYHVDSVVVDGVNQGAVTSYGFSTIAANHSITAWFSINVYTITATASAGGSISPSGAVGVNHGANRAFTITPNAGYHIDSVRVDGVNLGAIPSHTFTNVTANHTIAAYFSINVYTITATASSGGSIVPFGTVNVNHGGSTSFTITANTGSHIDSVVVDGVSVGAVSSHTFTNVTANHTIAAYFSINTYTITATASSGGTITPAGAVSATYGSNRSFTIAPNTGYHIDSVVVDGVNQGGVASHDFNNVTANHTITAYFSINVYSISASASAGGTITPAGAVNVNYGASQSFTIAPNTGYHIDSVVVDGVNAGAITSRNFAGVSANHTITAYFSINVYSISASASVGGTITPAGAVNVNYGASQSFTIAPNTGYHIDSVVVDGVNEGAIAARNISSVTANHTIAAYFSINVYSITASASAGGSITPSGAVSVNYGASQAFTITPNTGYHIDSVVVDGVNEGAIASRNLSNVTANHTIAAYFSINVYTIAASATAGGAITPSGSVNVNYGASQSFAITPNTGYHIDSVVVDGVSAGAITSRNFTAVSANHTIAAYFSINVYALTAGASAGGSISPSGTVNVNYGGSQSFTISPNTGYHIDSVVVDGVNEGTITVRNFTAIAANHAINAYFSINVYTITASASAGGSVSPSGAVNLNYGGSQSFTITPNTGYHIDSVVVDGVNEGAIAGRNFTGVTANHTIAAWFSINVYTITATASAGGSVTPSGAVGVPHGSNQSFTVTPNTGYHIDSVVVDGVNQGSGPSYLFSNVTANHAINAYFSINVYTIAAGASAGGSISPSGTVNVNYGGSQSFTITPNTGYHVDSVIVDGVNEGVLTGRTFTNVTANHAIAAYFSINVYTITASSSAGGSISPSGAVNVNYGASQSFTITPNAGYHIDSVVVNGVNEGAVTSRNFANVTANHTIAAYISINVYTITATAGPGGSVTPSGAVGVPHGSNQSFTVTPNAGYHIDSVVVDGVNQGNGPSYLLSNVTANHVFNAYFTINDYTIVATATSGGTITPSGAVSVVYGSDQSFTVAPGTGYHLDSVVADGANLGAVTAHTFTNIAGSHTIAAYFSIDTFIITATAGPGGTISPQGSVVAPYGSDRTFTVTPNTGYHIDSVVVDGVNRGAGAIHTVTGVTSNRAIAAWFSIDILTITASTSAGGSISPSGTVNLAYGASQLFTMTPNTGYHLDSILVDGVNQGAPATYNFANVTANRTISAHFSIDLFTISVTSVGGGTVSPSGAVVVPYGSNQPLVVTPNTGYHTDSVIVDGVHQGNAVNYLFSNVTANAVFTAYFSIDVFTIAATAGTGGSISPSGAVSVNYGSSQAFTITPATGYHIDSVVVDGVNAGAVGAYDFLSVTAGHTIAAWFTIDDFTIVASATSGGSISPAGAVSVIYGGSQSFSITPGTGYHLDSVVADGVNLGPVAAYEFTNITTSHTISAYFAIDTFIITASAGPGGSVAPSGAVVVQYGAGVSIAVLPDTGYHIDSVVVDGVNTGAVVSVDLAGVTTAHTVAAYFSINVYTVTAAGSAGGTISPSGSVNVIHGDDLYYAITADTGHHVDSVVVDGVNMGPAGGYTFTNIAGNHVINAWFSIDFVGVTATASAGGTISPAGAVFLPWGSGQQFTIAPNTGYHIDSVVVDGVNQGALTTYAFTNVTSARTIHAAFTINSYTIVASASLGGRVIPAGAIAVTHGAAQSFSFTPFPGNHLDSVVVDGANLGAIPSYNFANVTSGHTVFAYYSVTYFTVTATADSGGSITPSGAVQVAEGDDQTFTITPLPGHIIIDVFVDAQSVGSVSQYTFNAVTAPHTIRALFVRSVSQIIASASSGGTISPAGTVFVPYGRDTTFTMTPAAGYHLDSLLVDGVKVGAPASYTFSDVTTNHTIAALFSVNRYTIVATASTGGTISPAGTTTVTHGANRSYAITPATGYVVQDVRVDGVSVGPVTTYDFSGVTANHTIQATFAVQQFTITATAGPNGSVSPAGASQVNYGGSLTVFITPGTGYYILGVTVDGVPVGDVANYSFTNVTANHTIAATFTSNGKPTPPSLVAPIDNRIFPIGALRSVFFSWTPSTDPNPGDVLQYVLTITGRNVNFSTFEQAGTSITLDLSGLAIVPDSVYRWTVRVSDAQASVVSPDTFRFRANTATAVGDPSALPVEYALGANYPNPFNPATSIPFDLPERSEVSLTIYNILGVEVMTPAEGEVVGAGSYRRMVDFAELPSGTYFYRLSARGESGATFEKVMRLVLVR